MIVQRYTWEDALIEAQSHGIIDNGALLVCLKLARAINWAPGDGRPSGLYWANQKALETVGAGRSTYYRHRGELFKLGFLTEHKGNLIPQVPDLSHLETEESLGGTSESLAETEESSVEHTYSEDIYSEDEYSDVHSVKAGSASASPVIENFFVGDTTPPNLQSNQGRSGFSLSEERPLVPDRDRW